MKVLVCGGRDFHHYWLVDQILTMVEERNTITTIIHGDARGADALADKWGREYKKEILPFPADWEKHGKAAGPIRNSEMLLQARPDIVVAFPGGSGTADMIKKSIKAGVEVYQLYSGSLDEPIKWTLTKDGLIVEIGIIT